MYLRQKSVEAVRSAKPVKRNAENKKPMTLSKSQHGMVKKGQHFDYCDFDVIRIFLGASTPLSDSHRVKPPVKVELGSAQSNWRQLPEILN